MEYRIVPRTEAGLPAVVTGSTGKPRPPLSNEPWLTAHYTGNNIDYTGKDAAAVTRQIQSVFSKSKPFEYNYVIGQIDNDEIIEFAGKFQAAHSGGENSRSFGVLFLLGVGEEVTDLMIDKWRWLRDVLIADGSLAWDVEQLQHRQMPGAATACPGASVIRRWPEFLTPHDRPLPPGDDMIHPIKPIRNSDTRFYGVPLAPGKTYSFSLAEEIPADAVAAAMNVTVIHPDGSGFLTVWPGGEMPPTSTVNFKPGDVVNSGTVIGVEDGRFNIRIEGASAHATVDVTAYWVPSS